MEPTLWSGYLDGILRTPMPLGVTIISYADDVEVFLTAKTAEMLEVWVARFQGIQTLAEQDGGYTSYWKKKKEKEHQHPRRSQRGALARILKVPRGARRRQHENGQPCRHNSREGW